MIIISFLPPTSVLMQTFKEIYETLYIHITLVHEFIFDAVVTIKYTFLETVIVCRYKH
jgi:hypothetical protein